MSIIKKLDALADNERSRTFTGYSLDSIAALLEEMGNPHRGLRIIHIAGTNGKGSTAHFVQGLLRAAGFSTGLYTSPHLISVNERIRIDDGCINAAAFESIIEEIFAIIERNPHITPTWFDALTACAFRYFQLNAVDYAVIEAGLGGRLDSTNVITPLVSIITNVSLDHAAILGSCVEAIAREKAGIIKQKVPVITAACKSAREVIEKRARDHNAPSFAFDKDFFAREKALNDGGNRMFDYVLCAQPDCGIDARIIENIPLVQRLPEQLVNASLAITASLIVAPGMSDDAIRSGIGTCVVPGRMETLSREPVVIFDPAHNVAAIEAVCAHVKRAYPEKEIIAVLHCMADKDVDGIIACVQNMLTETLLYVIQSGERAFVPKDEKYRGALKVFDSEKELYEALRAFGNRAIILFTGSFRLYGCALRIAKKLSGKDTM